MKKNGARLNRLTTSHSSKPKKSLHPTKKAPPKDRLAEGPKPPPPAVHERIELEGDPRLSIHILEPELEPRRSNHPKCDDGASVQIIHRAVLGRSHLSDDRWEVHEWAVVVIVDPRGKVCGAPLPSGEKLDSPRGKVPLREGLWVTQPRPYLLSCGPDERGASNGVGEKARGNRLGHSLKTISERRLRDTT